MYVFSRHEITVGHSWQQFRALDMYVRTMMRGMEPREEEAWYLLMSHETVLARDVPEAARWYEYPIMQGWGQRWDGASCMYVCPYEVRGGSVAGYVPIMWGVSGVSFLPGRRIGRCSGTTAASCRGAVCERRRFLVFL